MEENNEQAPESPANPTPAISDAYPRVYVVLLTTIGTVVAGALFGTVLSILLGKIAGWDEILLSGTLAPDAAPNERWAMRTILGINHFTTFILGGLAAVLLFYRRYRTATGWGDWRDYLGIRYAPKFQPLVLACLLMFVATPLVLFLYNINQALPIPEQLRALESQTEDVIKGLLQMDNGIELLANLLIIALLPALGEELVFRGVMQKQLHRRISNPWVVILVSGAIFSFIHLQFEGFLPRWLLGILLGWLYWRSGSLWVSAAAHFFNNAIQVIGQYLYARQFSTVDLEKDVHMPWYAAVVSVGLMVFLMRAMRFSGTADKQSADGS